jgi:hypothetical protein
MDRHQVKVLGGRTGNPNGRLENQNPVSLVDDQYKLFTCICTINGYIIVVKMKVNWSPLQEVWLSLKQLNFLLKKN